MKIFGVQTFGVRGIRDGVYSFGADASGAGSDAPHDLVFVTGETGAGKTRLLELLVAVREAIAPSDEGIDDMPFVRPENPTSKAIVRFWLSPAERAIVGAGPVVDAEVVFGSDEPLVSDPNLVFLLDRYSHDDATPKFEYFGERRRLDVGGGEMDLDEAHQRRFRSSRSPRKFAFVPAFLLRLREDAPRAQRFARSLARLARALRYDVETHRLLSGSRPVGVLGELSASEADAVMFAATATLVGLSRSIVLVDDPLGSGLDRRRCLEGLGALGEDNQLIVTLTGASVPTGLRAAHIHLEAERGGR